MKLAWKLLAFASLLIAVTVIAPFGRAAWSEALVNNRTFSEPFIWFNSPEAIYWAFELLFFFAFGLLVAALFRSSHSHRWALAFGAAGGAFHFLLSRDQLMRGAPWSLYIWVYGNYVM